MGEVTIVSAGPSTYSWTERTQVVEGALDGTLDRSHVFASAERANAIDRRAPLLVDALPTGLRICMSGGCDLSYVGAILEHLGNSVHDTFVRGTSGDPVAEFVRGDAAEIRAFAPELIVMSTTLLLKRAMRGAANPGLPTDFAEQAAELDEIAADLSLAIDAARVACPAASIILLTNPLFDPGIFYSHEEASVPTRFTLREMQARHQLDLAMVARRKTVQLIDVNEVIGRYGTTTDEGRRGLIRFGELAGGHPEPKGAEVIAYNILALAQLASPAETKVKCAVLDLDNTLWHGILREDGHAKVRGAIRSDLMTICYHLTLRGIVLAIVSKNDEEVAELLADTFASYPGFWRAVVAVRTNWLPKSANLRSIADELNIGLDSLAFFDDQRHERDEVRENARGVRVFTDADLYQVLRYTPFIAAAPASEEAVGRAALYKAEAARRGGAETAVDAAGYERFLAASGFRLTVERATIEHVNRVYELLSRTNQQNVTLKRTSREALVAQLAAGDHEIYCCYLSDRYGAYGMIGVISAVVTPAGATIDELAFSCRAMGKGVEPAFLRRVAAAMLERAGELTIQVVGTERNRRMIELVEGVGFILDDDGSGRMTAATLDEREEPWIHWIDRQSEVADF